MQSWVPASLSALLCWRLLFRKSSTYLRPVTAETERSLNNWLTRLNIRVSKAWRQQRDKRLDQVGPSDAF